MNWILLIVIIAFIIFYVTRLKKGKRTESESDMQESGASYSIGISEERLNQIENEVESDKNQYLQNCRDNYSEYVSAARILFADTYDKMEEIDSKGNAWSKYDSEIEQIKKNKDIEGEIALLEKIMTNQDYTPGVYNRLAILYSKKKDFNAAYNICKKWFDSDYWKIPNMSSGSIKLLERMEKLEEKIKKSDG